jgi:3-isopropylmalate dehydratase small subunit
VTVASVVLCLGDDVSTDVIYPGRYMATVLPAETPQFAFADDPGFNGKLKAGEIPPGSVVVAGKNFGCGSSREQAVSCLKGHELVVIARGFARIFLQNAINLGLRVITCPRWRGPWATSWRSPAPPCVTAAPASDPQRFRFRRPARRSLTRVD